MDELTFLTYSVLSISDCWRNIVIGSEALHQLLVVILTSLFFSLVIFWWLLYNFLVDN